MARSALQAYERNHYFFGKLMTVRDFQAEQAYHLGKQWLHNRFLHDWGAVCGLRVRSAEDPANPWRLILEPGLAVDACGREIVVPAACSFDLRKLLAAAGITESEAAAGPFYVTLAYRECEAEPVPVYARDCAAAEECAPNRVIEGYRIGAADQAGTPDQDDALCSAVAHMVKAGGEALAVVATAPVGNPPTAVAADPAGHLLVADSAAQAICRLDPATLNAGKVYGPLKGTPRHLAAATGVIWIAHAAGGLEILAMADDGSAAQEFVLEEPYSALVAAPDGRRAFAVAESDAGPSVVVQITRGTSAPSVDPVPRLPADLVPTCLAMVGDRNLLVGSATPGAEGIWVWQEKGRRPRRAPLPAAPVAIAVQAAESDQPRVAAISRTALYVMEESPADTAREVAVPTAGELRGIIVQGGLVFISGTDAAGQPRVWGYRLEGGRHLHPAAVAPLTGSLAGLAMAPPRAFVATEAGVAVVESVQDMSALHRALVDQSMSCGPAADQPLVLAAVPLADGAPAADQIDNYVRKMLLSTGQLSALLQCTIKTLAACCHADQPPDEEPPPPARQVCVDFKELTPDQDQGFEFAHKDVKFAKVNEDGTFGAPMWTSDRWQEEGHQGITELAATWPGILVTPPVVCSQVTVRFVLLTNQEMFVTALDTIGRPVGDQVTVSDARVVHEVSFTGTDIGAVMFRTLDREAPFVLLEVCYTPAQ